MFGYLLCVLFAYYIVKPVSRAMFLTKFDIDKLPGLYILIAIFGGFLAYLYSKLATKSSLRDAVLWATVFWVATLLVMWWLIGLHLSWMIYVLNIWVSLFSIISVSQGWLVASNLFDTREAKRLYPLLGMGMVLGAAFGGEFTSRTAVLVGTENLLLASAVMVALAYACFRLSIKSSGTDMKSARAGQKEETDFSFTGMMRDIGRTRHLQIIVAMMVVMYLVDTLVEYQFQAMARTDFRGDQLTAFFGQFYGIYLNGIEFVFQLFVTSLVVRWLGVGGTLHIAPALIGLSSVATVGAPGVASASAVRLTEASTRYTLNKTGMELLYMPLPLELRNRIKAFIDISVDRMSRGLAGVLLVILTISFHMGVRGIAIVVIGLCVPWMLLSHLARREYVATVRRRLESRRLDLESTRVTVTGAETIRLLETTAAGPNPRQATYALRLLAEAPGYDIGPLLQRLVRSEAVQVRDKVYELATVRRYDAIMERAVQELRSAADPDPGGQPAHPLRSVAAYVLALAPDRASLAAEMLDDANLDLAGAAVEAVRADPALADQLISRDWLERQGNAEDPRRRRLAAVAIGVRGDPGTGLLHRLLEDSDLETARAACRSAGLLRDREYLWRLVQTIGYARLRGEAITALAGFGASICGFLCDCLVDQSMPMRVRREIPRVLKNIVDQRSVDVLLTAIDHEDLSIRAGVLKALNRLRESNPDLNFSEAFVNQQILREARYYYQLNAALAPFRNMEGKGATRLLARTIEERLKNTLERLFRLLGLRYPPKSIYSAYLAVQHHSHEEATAAIEFLDNVLSRDLKRVLMPLLDAPENLLEHGRELFGVAVPTTGEAIRELLHSHDPWLVACSMAAAAEMQLRDLAPEIAEAAAKAEAEVSEVAKSAEAALAA